MNTEIRNWPHFAIEMLSIVLLICCFIPLLKSGQLSGAEVPIHFDRTGAPDQMGTSKDLLWLPIMSFFIFAMLTLAEKFPKMINTPRKLSENGKEWLRDNGWKLMRELKLCLMAMMCYMCYWMYAVAAGKATEMPIWGFTLFIAATLAITIRFYYLLYNHN
jgi:hypothetical protein